MQSYLKYLSVDFFIVQSGVHFVPEVVTDVSPEVLVDQAIDVFGSPVPGPDTLLAERAIQACQLRIFAKARLQVTKTFSCFS